MQTIHAFIKANKISLQPVRVENRPSGGGDWKGADRHWACLLLCGKTVSGFPRAINVWFTQGAGHTKAPTAADVLDCLASDAQTGAQDFAEFCADMVGDPDSIKARKTWKSCRKTARRLDFLLTSASLHSLVNEVERM